MAQDRHAIGGQPDFLRRFAQRRRSGRRVAGLDAPARKADLPGMIGKVGAPLRQQHLQSFGPVDERNQHRRRAWALLRGRAGGSRRRDCARTAGRDARALGQPVALIVGCKSKQGKRHRIEAVGKAGRGSNCTPSAAALQRTSLPPITTSNDARPDRSTRSGTRADSALPSQIPGNEPISSDAQKAPIDGAELRMPKTGYQRERNGMRDVGADDLDCRQPRIEEEERRNTQRAGANGRQRDENAEQEADDDGERADPAFAPCARAPPSPLLDSRLGDDRAGSKDESDAEAFASRCARAPRDRSAPA